MSDMRGFSKDLDKLAKAVQTMQQRLETMEFEQERSLPPAIAAETNLFLMRRHQVLLGLGIDWKVSRAAWSHDRGDAIIFDAWEHLWVPDDAGNPFFMYPMRTKKYYNQKKSRSERNRGHTRWQHHIDMVLDGQRSAITIMPVKSDSNNPNRRTRGWLPQYATGQIKSERGNDLWFVVDKVHPI